MKFASGAEAVAYYYHLGYTSVGKLREVNGDESNDVRLMVKWPNYVTIKKVGFLDWIAEEF